MGVHISHTLCLSVSLSVYIWLICDNLYGYTFFLCVSQFRDASHNRFVPTSLTYTPTINFQLSLSDNIEWGVNSVTGFQRQLKQTDGHIDKNRLFCLLHKRWMTPLLSLVVYQEFCLLSLSLSLSLSLNTHTLIYLSIWSTVCQ